MYSQQTFQGFAHSSGLMQDANCQYNMGGYQGIGHPHHPQTFFPFSTVKSDYGEMGMQGVGDCSAQVVPWSHLVQLDPAHQMNIHGNQQGREQMVIPEDTKMNIKSERESEPEIKEEPTSNKLTPQSQNAIGESYYAQAWGGSTWSNPGVATANKPQASVKPTPVPQYPENQSPTGESGVSSLDNNSRCSSSTSPNSSVHNIGTPRSLSSGGSEGICSDNEEVSGQHLNISCFDFLLSYYLQI